MHLFKRLVCTHANTTLHQTGSWIETETDSPTSHREYTRALVFDCEQCGKQVVKKEVRVTPTSGRKVIVFRDCIKQKAR